MPGELALAVAQLGAGLKVAVEQPAVAHHQIAQLPDSGNEILAGMNGQQQSQIALLTQPVKVDEPRSQPESKPVET